MEKKHAYLIMAHHDFESLKYLIRALDDSRNDIFLHIDKKAGKVDFTEITSWVKYSRLYFVPRITVYWGHISIVRCEINMLKFATGIGHYHYYHVISGADFPLKSQDEIHEFFADKDREYISYHKPGEYDDEYDYKVQYYFPLIKWIGQGLFSGDGKKMALWRFVGRHQDYILELQKLRGIDRRKKFPGITFSKGENWISITDDFARFMVEQRRNILHMFNMTNGPYEFFAQTIALNSEFRERVECTSYRQIDWVGEHPREFTYDDLDMLLNSQAFWGRKIMYSRQPRLVWELMEHIGVEHSQKVAQQPLVSVIVPIYNVQDYLWECMESLAAQTYTNIEVLLIDDGSKDGSSALAERFARNDRRFKYIRQENRGLSGARNHGIDLANGEYLAFVDSDDWVFENYIEKMLDTALESDADVVVSGFVKENGSTGSYVKFRHEDYFSKSKAMRVLGNIFTKEYLLFILAWNKLYRREVFNELRYAQGKIHEDEYAIHRVIDHADYMVAIPDVLYHYRIREDSITGVKQDRDLRHFHVFEAHQDRVACCKNMIYRDSYMLIVYSMFEELIMLMLRYDDTTYKKEHLNSKFRKLMILECIRNYDHLDSHQKREYTRVIASPRAYSKRICKIIKKNAELCTEN